jgi:hypothetical protein
VYDRCAAASPEHYGISYIVGEPGDGDVSSVLSDYKGDALHGPVVPPLHGGKMRNALVGDGSVSRIAW